MARDRTCHNFVTVFGAGALRVVYAPENASFFAWISLDLLAFTLAAGAERIGAPGP
jgi:hypothetical protein